MRTVGVVREDREKGIVEIASPVGVVAAVIPSTNPTSTAIYKTLISLKAGNAIVMSPHPGGLRGAFAKRPPCSIAPRFPPGSPEWA